MKLMPTNRSGFALPTILIASVVMLIVMVTAIQAATSISTGLKNQYYNKVAEEAAESGIARAQNCLKVNNYVAGWSTANPLTPNTDCDGTVIGGNSAYVLDTGSIRSSYSLGTPTTTTTAVTLSVSSKFELLRASNGNVWRTYSTNLKGTVSLGVNPATSLSSGIFQSCAVYDGKTWCWGKNDQGQLGKGTIDGLNTLVPEKVERKAGALLGKTDKFVVVGNLAACIVTNDNLVYCMGDNATGQLGDNTTTDKNTPTLVTMGGMSGTITQVVMGKDFACALASGEVYCWGDANDGQLGGGNTTDRLVPTIVVAGSIGTAAGRPVTEISTAPKATFVCAVATVAAAGKAYCWGDSRRSQIGDGWSTDRSTPTAVSTTTSLSGKNIAHISASGGDPFAAPFDNTTRDKTYRAHACAVTTDGQLSCWGSNQYGQMGQDTNSLTRQATPIRVLGGALTGKTITQVATSYGTVCALTSDNLLRCWGQNSYGQVGDGTNDITNNTYKDLPVAVVVADPGISGKTMTSLNGGANRQCTIADGISYCWGYNNTGQLGDGTTIDSDVPIETKILRKFAPTILY